MSHDDCTCCRSWRRVDLPSAIEVDEALHEGLPVRGRPLALRLPPYTPPRGPSAIVRFARPEPA